jgi:hypothetical protein
MKMLELLYVIKNTNNIIISYYKISIALHLQMYITNKDSIVKYPKNQSTNCF